MCRYGFHNYKDHYACFDCRKVFRIHPDIDWPEHLRPAEGEVRDVVCPDCSKPMASMGFDFKAPKRGDLKQWEKVRLLYEAGFTYHSCGCGGPGERPKTLNEVPAFLEAMSRKSEGEKLAECFADRA